MFHDLLDIIVGLSKRGELDGKLGSVASNQIAIGGTCMGEIPLQELGMLFCNWCKKSKKTLQKQKSEHKASMHIEEILLLKIWSITTNVMFP